MPGSVVVLPNHSSWVSKTNALTVVGEVQNNTGSRVGAVRVTVVFLDGSDVELDSWFTYITMAYLEPGQRTCFRVTLFPIPASYSSYRFDSVTYSTSLPGRVPVVTVVTESGAINQYGQYEVVGTARSDDAQPAGSLMAVGTLYAGAGVVVDCWHGSVTPSTLASGQVGDFSVLFAHRQTYTDVASFRSQFQGSPQ